MSRTARALHSNNLGWLLKNIVLYREGRSQSMWRCHLKEWDREHYWWAVGLWSNVDVEMRKKKQKKMMKGLNMTIAYGSCGLACCTVAHKRDHTTNLLIHTSLSLFLALRSCPSELNFSLSLLELVREFLPAWLFVRTLWIWSLKLTHQPCGDNHSPPQIFLIWKFLPIDLFSSY